VVGVPKIFEFRQFVQRRQKKNKRRVNLADTSSGVALFVAQRRDPHEAMMKILTVGMLAAIVAGAPTPVEEVQKPQVDEHGRELFPLIAGAKRAQAQKAAARSGVNPAMALAGDAIKGPTKALERLALNDDLNTVVSSDNRCTRRNAMARAAGLAAGLALASVNAPGYAAETKSVKMGSDAGQLVFQPDEIKICKGDTVTWVNNKGGPHNVVFDEEGVPSGVDAEAISMDDQLGDEGATYSKKFDVAGKYDYFCEPHRGAGMNAVLIVE
jgi:plastocyanin